MVKKKEDKELTEKEYFELEMHQANIETNMYKVACSSKNLEIFQKEKIIFELKSKIMSVNISTEERNLQNLKSKLENLKTNKGKVRQGIAERLGISGDWGYNHETLKIVES